jgi:glycosyltransferase involved in cell wall biosynthesis
MRDGKNVCVIIPALDEEAALPLVLKRVPPWVDRVIVVDNGSRDGTRRVAFASGASVVLEPVRGYGRACLAGIRAALDVDVLVFLDADGSDHPEQMVRVVDPIVTDGMDLVIGSRNLGELEAGAMSAPQRLGNYLAPLLIRLLWGQRFTDLGPFRAIRTTSLQELHMDAPTYGWTVQMQIRASRLGLRCVEVPVDYSRRRGGRSKISGTVRGVVGAGAGILACVFRELWLTLFRTRTAASGPSAGHAIVEPHGKHTSDQARRSGHLHTRNP